MKKETEYKIVARNVETQSYFKKVPGYRGDFLRILLQSERGFELATSLNLRVALSNFQGF